MMRSLPIAMLAGVIVFAPSAEAKKRTELHPYLQIDQTALADLTNGGPVSTYSSIAAGIDASTSTSRADAQISAQYQYRKGLGRNADDSHVISGLARGRFDIVPNLLSLESGALATRTRTDIRGTALNPGLGDPPNVSQLYSAYVGPSLSTNVGALNVNGFYRLGYTKVETETPTFLPSGSPTIGSFDNAMRHSAGLSVGMKSGLLPFGWTVSGGYSREDASQLDQRYEGKFARADIVVPLTPTFAVTGGAGYEKISASQRDPVLDASGNPVVTPDGRYVTDPASPRRLSYDTSGFIWDTGVLWRPSRRTSLEAKVGRRYGGMTYTGDLSWQISENESFQVGAYDGITTFGQQVGGALSRVPTRFVVSRDPFSNQFGGCVFGGEGQGAGACLSPALQSVSQGVYRSRGVGAIYRKTSGPLSWGIAAGYAQRKFFAPPVAGFATNGTTDASIYAQGGVTYQIDDVSIIDTSTYINWFDAGVAGAPRVLGVGGTASYRHNFGPRLSGAVAFGLYYNSIEGVESSLVGAAQLGARYTF
ncbi:MAG: hypothetical protein ACOYLK_02885 [Sphingomonas sp.]